MIVSIIKPILEILYYKRAALYLSSYEGHYDKLKRKQWNCATTELYTKFILSP